MRAERLLHRSLLVACLTLLAMGCADEPTAPGKVDAGGVGCSSWTVRPEVTFDLHGIWGTDANNVWAVGMDDQSTAPPTSSEKVLKWNGNAWTLQSTGLAYWLFAV